MILYVYPKPISHRLSLCPLAFSCCVTRSCRWQACCFLTTYNKFVSNWHVSSAASCRVVESARSRVTGQAVHTTSHLPMPPLREFFVFDFFIDPRTIGTLSELHEPFAKIVQYILSWVVHPGDRKLRRKSPPPFPFPSHSYPHGELHALTSCRCITGWPPGAQSAEQSNRCLHRMAQQCCNARRGGLCTHQKRRSRGKPVICRD